ncbi:hypothetical protein FOZ63_033434, partial [Perkinsus olseni]
GGRVPTTLSKELWQLLTALTDDIGPPLRGPLTNGRNPDSEGLFHRLLVELYHVTFSEEGATYENQLRVGPQDYLIHTVIEEPRQDQSADLPQFTVRTVEVLSLTPRRHLTSHESPIFRRTLQAKTTVAPESEKFSFTTQIDGVLWGKTTLTRSYYRHMPPEDVEIKGILIQYHGWGGSCEEWEKYSKTSTFTDKHGLILITACGSNYGWHSRAFYSVNGWNAGTCCIQRQDIDDVEYTKIILERENKKKLPVYGYGYSNGGMMVESLLCHKVIQGAVAVNAVLALNPGLQGSFKACDNLYNNASLGPKPSVPRVASVHCIDDEVVPYKGSVLSKGDTIWGTATLFPRTNRDIRRWARRFGCAEKDTTLTPFNGTSLKEWNCPGEERAVSIKRSNCGKDKKWFEYAHSVVRTDEFDPAKWAVDFFLHLD